MQILVECPRCCATMVPRQNKKNGNTFYGCDQFPSCRQTMSISEYEQARKRKGYELVGEVPPGYEHWEDAGDL